MCGISGILYSDPGRVVEREIIEKMNGVIRHRGPDSDGFYLRPGVALAMRRLAIVDLQTGDQPLANESNDVWIVFNGEIYNAPALRADLEKRGHVFRTHSDTEAIVHLYEEHGLDCVRHLRGMFAFAIWDEKRRRLLIARDRVGKKPLYYAEHDGALLWGSELKCLLQYPGFPREVDAEALHHFLTLQYVPDPLSALRHARKLPPAHRLVWEGGRVTIERYWELDYREKWTAPEAELRAEVRRQAEDAVRIRLMSDVPLGAHLSGGIDSAIVVGLMAGMMNRPVKTFSIGFEEAAFNELHHARAVAEKFKTEHHEFIVAPKALEVLPELVAHFDEPFADAAAIPTWYLAKMTREHVTVALNGDGGDEAFGGYQRYYADPLADLYRLVPSSLRHGIFDRLAGLLPRGSGPVESSIPTALRHLTRAADLPVSASVVRWGSFFTEEEKDDLYTGEMRAQLRARPSWQLLDESFRHALADSRIDRTLSTDVLNYLPGALLPKVDRMTMAHSLEARSPFLDHQLLEFAARLPTDCKVRGTTTKRILRETFADVLPPSIAGRGKMGFSVPLGSWFRESLREPVREILFGSDARLYHHLRRERVQVLFDENVHGRQDHGKRLWALLNLEVWLKTYAS
jgi:asparagine synthase (glutamine-hydrolysing)